MGKLTHNDKINKKFNNSVKCKNVTWRIPLASISKVTSICGTPRGAGGMPVKSNLPKLNKKINFDILSFKADYTAENFNKS